MSEQQFSISLCRDDDEVAVFNVQPDNNDSVDDTFSDYEFEAATAYFNDGVAADTYKQLEEVQSHPPPQLLEDDPEVSTSEQVNIQILKGLNAKCRSVKEQFENEQEMVREVSRHNCVKDMLTHFRQQSVADSKICLSVKGQHAVANGVLREVYSVFWDSSVSSYCKGSSHFTFPVTAAKSQDDCCYRSDINTSGHRDWDTSAADIESHNTASRNQTGIRRVFGAIPPNVALRKRKRNPSTSPPWCKTISN